MDKIDFSWIVFPVLSPKPVCRRLFDRASTLSEAERGLKPATTCLDQCKLPQSWCVHFKGLQGERLSEIAGCCTVSKSVRGRTGLFSKFVTLSMAFCTTPAYSVVFHTRRTKRGPCLIETFSNVRPNSRLSSWSIPQCCGRPKTLSHSVSTVTRRVQSSRSTFFWTGSPDPTRHAPTTSSKSQPNVPTADGTCWKKR
jgi:hypothetical protein